jgi:hypothetical protein
LFHLPAIGDIARYGEDLGVMAPQVGGGAGEFVVIPRGSPALSMTTRNTLCAYGSFRHRPVITKVFHAYQTTFPAPEIVAD